MREILHYLVLKNGFEFSEHKYLKNAEKAYSKMVKEDKNLNKIKLVAIYMDLEIIKTNEEVLH